MFTRPSVASRIDGDLRSPSQGITQLGEIMLTQPLLKPALSRASAEFAEDVRCGLTKSGQREILSKYLYDEVGSALFEAICLLAEYGLTRADMRLLRCHADEMVARMPIPSHVAELGSGSGKKTRWIL